MSSMKPFIPLREIYYYQEIFYDDDFSHYYLPPIETAPPSDWAFPPVRMPSEFSQAYRVTDGFLQRLILFAHRPPHNYALEMDDWSRRLYSDLLELRPLRWRMDDFTEMRLNFGFSPKAERFYVR